MIRGNRLDAPVIQGRLPKCPGGGCGRWPQGGAAARHGHGGDGDRGSAALVPAGERVRACGGALGGLTQHTGAGQLGREGHPSSGGGV